MFILIYTTHDTKEGAEKIIKHLLKSRLIACANIFPIESMYWWRDKIETSAEVVSILKTREENWKKVKQEIEKIHPYETPCIIKIDVESNDSFENWIKKETDTKAK